MNEKSDEGVEERRKEKMITGYQQETIQHKTIERGNDAPDKPVLLAAVYRLLLAPPANKQQTMTAKEP